MKIYKIDENVQLPEFQTEGSAAFDIRAFFNEGDKIRSYNPHNKEMELPVKQRVTDTGTVYTFQIPSQFRVLIPTGMILNIPKNHVVKLYIRSSMALKYGITLANNVGIIDSDYVDPLFVMLHNTSDTPITISGGDRIAQCMLEKCLSYNLEEAKRKPSQKTDRDGGLGSTGDN